MIYYVVGIHKVSHNEHVVNSYSTAEAAVADKERYEVEAPSYDYRIDTVLSNEEVREQNARIKAEMNRQFGRAKMDHEEGYPDATTRGPRHSSEFTSDELFPQQMARADHLAQMCMECGALVAYEATILHTVWHNKLLP